MNTKEIEKICHQYAILSPVHLSEIQRMLGSVIVALPSEDLRKQALDYETQEPYEYLRLLVMCLLYGVSIGFAQRLHVSFMEAGIRLDQRTENLLRLVLKEVAQEG